MRHILSLLLMGILISSCSPKTPYTNSVKEKYGLTDADISKIQFYTSDDIIMYKSASDSKTQTNKGEVVVSSNKEEERVLIKKGTPCVVEKVVDGNSLAISFEAGENKYLVFTSASDRSQYFLKTKEGDTGKKILEYAGDKYSVTSMSSTVYLVFKVKTLNKYKSKQKVVSGRKIE